MLASSSQTKSGAIPLIQSLSKCSKGFWKRSNHVYLFSICVIQVFPAFPNPKVYINRSYSIIQKKLLVLQSSQWKIFFYAFPVHTCTHQVKNKQLPCAPPLCEPVIYLGQHTNGRQCKNRLMNHVFTAGLKGRSQLINFWGTPRSSEGPLWVGLFLKSALQLCAAHFRVTNKAACELGWRQIWEIIKSTKPVLPITCNTVQNKYKIKI